MLLFWGCKGINNTANIFAFAVKSNKSTQKGGKLRRHPQHKDAAEAKEE